MTELLEQLGVGMNVIIDIVEELEARGIEDGMERVVNLMEMIDTWIDSEQIDEEVWRVDPDTAFRDMASKTFSFLF